MWKPAPHGAAGAVKRLKAEERLFFEGLYDAFNADARVIAAVLQGAQKRLVVLAVVRLRAQAAGGIGGVYVRKL